MVVLGNKQETVSELKKIVSSKGILISDGKDVAVANKCLYVSDMTENLVTDPYDRWQYAADEMKTAFFSMRNFASDCSSRNVQGKMIHIVLSDGKDDYFLQMDRGLAKAYGKKHIMTNSIIASDYDNDGFADMLLFLLNRNSSHVNGECFDLTGTR